MKGFLDQRTLLLLPSKVATPLFRRTIFRVFIAVQSHLFVAEYISA